MKYYLSCNSQAAFNETLSTLRYYGFKIISEDRFSNLSTMNAFTVDTETKEATFSHLMVLGKALSGEFINLYDFEDQYLKEQNATL